MKHEDAVNQLETLANKSGEGQITGEASRQGPKARQSE